MNEQNSLPPDKEKSNKNLHQHDESTLNGIEIKQEPTVKQEPEDKDDMVTVSTSECATSGSVVNLIGDEQMGDAYDLTKVCELDEAKSEVKKEKIDKGTEKCSGKCSGKGAIGSSSSSNDPKNNHSNKKQSKPKPGSVESKATKKIAAKIKPKSNIHKKKSIVSKKQHKCSTCDYATSYKSHFDYHIRKHTGEKPFPCTYCAKRFTVKSSLQKHMRTHVNEFLFNCSNCLKEFSQSDEKSEHEISCKIRRFECHLCKEYSTFYKSDLEYHMRVHHTGTRPFGCEKCSKKFSQQIALKRHMKTHINPRPLKIKCSVCYRKFSQRIEKDEHESNCKRRGYECFLCKEFNSDFLIILKNHMRIHTGVRPFQCEMCQKSFSFKQNLRRHAFRCGIQK